MLYDVKAPVDNYDPAEREYDAIFIGGGAGGRFGSSYFRAMGGNQLTIDADDHLGGKCPKDACVIHHYLFDIAVEMDHARLMAEKSWYPKIPERVEIIPMLEDFVNGRALVYDFMYWQSKNQLNMQFILNRRSELLDRNTVRVEGREFKAKNLVIGSGARASIPRVPGTNLEGVESYETFLDLDYEPKDVVVIGASKTGLPWSSFFQAIGCRTTLVEMVPLLSNFQLDDEVRDFVIEMMKYRGMCILDRTTLVSIDGRDGRVESVTVRGPEGMEEVIKADMVFLGTGCIPNSEIAEPLAVALGPRREIVVDSHMRSSIPGVYAIGDVTGGPMEMWKARMAGMTAAKNILGKEAELDISTFPDFLHTTYEITWVGMTEQEAREKFGKIAVVAMPVKNYPVPNPLPTAERSTLIAHNFPELTGFQKVIYDAKSRRLVGAHHVGYGAKDAFQYIAYMIEKGATADDMANLKELFLNPTHFIQLTRLRAGMESLADLG